MVWRDTTAERVLFIGTPSVTLNMEGHDSNMEGHDSNMEGHDSNNRNMEGRTFLLYHKTVVAVNAPSARVTEGVPINNTLSLSRQQMVASLVLQCSVM